MQHAVFCPTLSCPPCPSSPALQAVSVDEPVYDPTSPSGVSTGAVGYRQYTASALEGGGVCGARVGRVGGGVV